MPAPEPGAHNVSDFLPRYEDVTQSGRVLLPALAAALGKTVWRELIEPSPVTELMRAQGVVPILRRMVVRMAKGPFSPLAPFDVVSAYQLAHEPAPSGGAARLFALMWLEARAPHGSAYAPPSQGDEPALVGTLFAEHVLTRLFGAPEERRVTRLDAPGLPEVPPHTHAFVAADALLEPPLGAATLTPAPREEPHTFALSETDSNQHVNSLAYPRIAEAHALRALAEHGVEDAYRLAVTGVETCWAKPLFAGDRVLVATRAYRVAERFVVACSFAPEGASRPHATVRIELEREG